MAELLWRVLAWALSREPVVEWLIARATRTPYSHITSADGRDVYMRRFWLFNPYFDDTYLRRYRWCPISVRLHHILREDRDRHLHDHPWNARTIILAGSYIEERDGGVTFERIRGSTTRLRYGEFHRITEVGHHIGAVTLFITGRKRGTWGFKVPWREYVAREGRT